MTAPLTPAPFTPELIRPDARARVIFLCDHASNHIPPEYQGLGLDPAVLGRHVAWDIGAAEVTRRLAGAFAAPAVLTTVSRLVLDVNRFLDDPASMPGRSDGIEVPGNRRAGPAEHRDRAARIFHPYHTAVDRRITALVAAGLHPAVVSVHSCTDRMDGQHRPWHVGVLHARNDRLATPLLRHLRASPGLVVGDNQPYSLKTMRGYTTDIHAERRSLPYVALEIRQDLITTTEGAAIMAGLIAAALSAAIAGLD